MSAYRARRLGELTKIWTERKENIGNWKCYEFDLIGAIAQQFVFVVKFLFGEKIKETFEKISKIVQDRARKFPPIFGFGQSAVVWMMRFCLIKNLLFYPLDEFCN